MTTDWGPIVQTSIGAVAAIGDGFVGAWIQGRQQRRVERDRRRERAAEILAEVQALLTDATPQPLGLHAEEPTFEQKFTCLWTGGSRTRIPLLTLEASNPSKRVAGFARESSFMTPWGRLENDQYIMSTGSAARSRMPSGSHRST